MRFDWVAGGFQRDHARLLVASRGSNCRGAVAGGWPVRRRPVLNAKRTKRPVARATGRDGPQQLSVARATGTRQISFRGVAPGPRVGTSALGNDRTNFRRQEISSVTAARPRPAGGPSSERRGRQPRTVQRFGPAGAANVTHFASGDRFLWWSEPGPGRTDPQPVVSGPDHHRDS